MTLGGTREERLSEKYGELSVEEREKIDKKQEARDKILNFGINSEKIGPETLNKYFLDYLNFDETIVIDESLSQQLKKLAVDVYTNGRFNTAIAVLNIIHDTLGGENKNISNAIYKELLRHKEFNDKCSVDKINILKYAFSRYYETPITSRSNLSSRYSNAYSIRDNSEKFVKSIKELSDNNPHKDLDLPNVYKLFNDLFVKNGLNDASKVIYFYNIKNTEENSVLSMDGKFSDIKNELYNYGVNNGYNWGDYSLTFLDALVNEIIYKKLSVENAFYALDAIIFSTKPNQKAIDILKHWGDSELFNRYPIEKQVDIVFSAFKGYKYNGESLYIEDKHIKKGKDRFFRYYKKLNDEKNALQLSLSEFIENPDSNDDKLMDDNMLLSFFGNSADNLDEAAKRFIELPFKVQSAMVLSANSNGNLRNDTVPPTNTIKVIMHACKLQKNGKSINFENICKLDAAKNGEENELTKIAMQDEESLNMQDYSIDCSDFLENFSVNDYIARYEEAQRIAEIRESYGDSPIIVDNKPNSDSNNPSGQQIAAGLLQGQNSRALDSYKISNSEISDSESSALRYTAFDVAFSNKFNQNDPLVKELVDLKIDLRSEISNYGIYNFENGFLNSKARDKFVSEKLQNGGLSEDELRELGETIKELPTNVDNNYNILCGNFYTDQEGFEKIAKIHALGEVIENIKKLFEKVENINTPNLGKLVGLELDKEKPAEIIGDCLFLKGKSNGIDVNIKYDLSSGKLFMNSFLQKSYDKINIGNTQPNTQIGSIDSFEDILNGYNPESFIQPTENSDSTDNGQQSKEESNSNQIVQGKLKKLSENKLLQNLGKIGEIVGKKAEIQSQKNSAIINFLKSFNIGFNSGELSNLDFNKESNLYDVLQIIDDSADITSDDTDIGSIKYFNNVFMPKIMKYSGLKWGESNQYGRQRTEENQNEYDYTFDEKNSNKQASLLRKDSENFSINPQKFTETLNYGADYQLGFANIINSGEITVGELPKRKLNQEKMRTFMSNLEHDRESYDWLSKNLETVSTDDGQIN